MGTQHLDGHGEKVGAAAGGAPHVHQRQGDAQGDAGEHRRQKRVAAVAGNAGKDHVLEEGAPQHGDEGLDEKALAQEFQAQQDQGHVEHQGGDADGQIPQMVADQGQAGQPARGEVGVLGKVADGDGIQKARCNVVQLVDEQGPDLFHRQNSLFGWGSPDGAEKCGGPPDSRRQKGAPHTADARSSFPIVTL